MTKDEALLMAIEALAKHATDESDEGWQYIEAIQACKEALEQPTQEPIHNCPNCNSLFTKEIYSTPAPSWQGLSDDEINQACLDLFDTSAMQGDLDFAYSIEARLKEKNHV